MHRSLHITVAVLRWLTVAGLLVLAWGLFSGAFASGSIAAAAGQSLLALGCIIFAGIIAAPALAGWAGYYIGGFLGSLFYPEDYNTEPPEALLRSLRMRIRERMHLSVEKQLRGLLKAYRPHPTVFHLLAVNAAAQERDWHPVVAEAATALSKKKFRRFEALVLADPPLPLDSRRLAQREHA
ncbi:hypothetical protein OpiT1DRAFT_04659 [Opitutaceae bacterium TAV1]|nr:hypothetical protein OpiT1DRAFT_04659 [Opitutaceae bacterium TAV1]